MSSNRFTDGDYFPKIPHLGYKGEVGDLRGDVERAFERVAVDLDTNSEEGDAILGAALTGDAILELLGSDLAEDISIAGDGLNTSAAGEVVKQLTVSLKSSDDLVHSWANFIPSVTPAAVVADGDITAPTVKATGTVADPPKFDSGQLEVDVVFDTDAGATKTYQVGDLITVTIDVSGVPTLSGVSTLVKTYNVVA